ncbi:hypothetical protein [Altericista sp. CCNU0014]|uniref:hypothetical protein n=1 Tax=Altericista sp. CCNU0014 TaxID=3082949 RepID=UPI00385165F2
MAILAHRFVKRLPQTMHHPDEQPAFQRGSGNVFADLSMDDADELFAMDTVCTKCLQKGILLHLQR